MVTNGYSRLNEMEPTGQDWLLWDIVKFQESDNFAPVAHDVSFRIALARMMVEKLDSLVMDVETAFLYGDIEEVDLYEITCGNGRD